MLAAGAFALAHVRFRLGEPAMDALNLTIDYIFSDIFFRGAQMTLVLTRAKHTW